VALSSFSVSPASVSGGSPSTGTVGLSSAAPTGGSCRQLSSNLPGSASVPSSVTVAAGATSASFTVTTFNVAATTVQLSATLRQHDSVRAAHGEFAGLVCAQRGNGHPNQRGGRYLRDWNRDLGRRDAGDSGCEPFR